VEAKNEKRDRHDAGAALAQRTAGNDFALKPFLLFCHFLLKFSLTVFILCTDFVRTFLRFCTEIVLTVL
jgi:hypothetical protein